MRTRTLSKTSISLLALACVVLLTCSGFASIQESTRTVVATVIPQGKEFRVQFDEAQVTSAYSVQAPRDVATGQASGKRRAPLPSTWTSREQFKESLQRDGLSRLKTLFPNGIPQEATGKVKITIWVKPPAWGVSIEW